MLSAQIFAAIIFVLMFVLVVVEIFERHIVTIFSGLCMLVIVFGFCMKDFGAIINTLNLHSICEPTFWIGEGGEESGGINWSTIIFIFGMMVMVEGMGKSGFFKWLCLSIARLVNYRIIPIFISFMTMSAFLAMFIDSITVILFLAAVTVELSRLLKFNPIPLVLSEIFCANLGGSATMCGDPPNIIIGTSLHYSFFDFLTNTGLIALVCFVVTIIYFYLVFKKELKQSEITRGEITNIPDISSVIQNKASFIMSIIIFFISVLLLITHAQTTLSVASIGCIALVLTLLSTLLTSGIGDVKYIFKHLDYKPLIFFIGLFITVGGLEQTGILEIIAGFIQSICGGNIYLMVAVIIWLSAIASAFIDNIPFAATMVPVIKSMGEMGMPIDVLAWTLAMGTDLGGNATPIGASANVVGTSVCAKDGHPIGWGKYCKYLVPATLMVVTISMVCI